MPVTPQNSHPIATTARRGLRIDAGTLLGIYTVALFVIPSNLIFPPLGAAGTPAGTLGILMLAWWCACRTVPSLWSPSSQPVRLAVLLFLLAVLASYVKVGLQPLQAVEINSADRAILRVLSFIGVALVAADGLRDREQLVSLLRRVLVCSTLVALVGIVQFYSGFDVVQYVQIPGLTSNGQLISVGERSNLRRVAGTAAHPLEFGVVMAITLGIAIHWLLTARRRLARQYVCVFLLALAAVLSGSRSAILATLVVLGTLYAGWDKRRRRAALLMIPLVVIALRLAAPGVLGTLVSLVRNAGRDDSIAGRTDDYAVAADFVARDPLLGRGFGTFVPDVHIILDNQYLAMLIEGGVIGVASLFGLFGIAWCSARGGRRVATDDAGRHLGQTLAACIAASSVVAATFDAFSFPMYFGLLGLLVGCCGAWWRIARTEAQGLHPGAFGQAPVDYELAPADRGAPSPPT